VEALVALVEMFAELPDAPATSPLPLAAQPSTDEDVLISLLEDVIDTVDVLSVVPIRFHLAATEGGGMAGDMEVVPVGKVEIVGPVPKAVSYHGLSMVADPAGFRCRAVIGV